MIIKKGFSIRYLPINKNGIIIFNIDKDNEGLSILIFNISFYYGLLSY